MHANPAGHSLESGGSSALLCASHPESARPATDKQQPASLTAARPHPAPAKSATDKQQPASLTAARPHPVPAAQTGAGRGLPYTGSQSVPPQTEADAGRSTHTALGHASKVFNTHIPLDHTSAFAGTHTALSHTSTSASAQRAPPAGEPCTHLGDGCHLDCDVDAVDGLLPDLRAGGNGGYP